jgi:hypothetical protein
MAKKTLAESIASIEQLIIDLERMGNTRAAKVAKMVLIRLKKEKDPNKGVFSPKNKR